MTRRSEMSASAAIGSHASPVARSGGSEPDDLQKQASDNDAALQTSKAVQATPHAEGDGKPFVARDPRALADHLRTHASASVKLQDMRLTSQDQLVFDGESLDIDSAYADRPAAITLEYDLRILDKPWAALTIRGGKVRIRGVRFVIDCHAANIACRR